MEGRAARCLRARERARVRRRMRRSRGPDPAPPRPVAQAPLAPDVQLLHAQAGIRSFVSVAIGPAGDPFGTLLLGRRQPNAFDDHW
jgi:hypothetical protein